MVVDVVVAVVGVGGVVAVVVHLEGPVKLTVTPLVPHSTQMGVWPRDKTALYYPNDPLE